MYLCEETKCGRRNRSLGVVVETGVHVEGDVFMCLHVCVH